jgi:hypothetical protein
MRYLAVLVLPVMPLQMKPKFVWCGGRGAHGTGRLPPFQHSATASHLLHSTLEFASAEIISASQLEAHINSFGVTLLQERRTLTIMSLAISAQTLKIKWTWYPRPGIEWGFSVPETIIVDTENILIHGTFSSFLQNAMQKEFFCCVLIIQPHLELRRKHRLETNATSATGGMNAVDGHAVLGRLSVPTVRTLEIFVVSLSTAVIPQLPLWHLHCVVSTGTWVTVDAALVGVHHGIHCTPWSFCHNWQLLCEHSCHWR